jgi:hypothetical protein
MRIYNLFMIIYQLDKKLVIIYVFKVMWGLYVSHVMHMENFGKENNGYFIFYFYKLLYIFKLYLF